MRSSLFLPLILCFAVTPLMAGGPARAQEKTVSDADVQDSVSQTPAESDKAEAGKDGGKTAKDKSEPTQAEKIKQAVKEASRFLRLRKNEDGKSVAMETSITRYESDRFPGVSVDLIGVVHIGDRDYYEKLNKIFEQYDALLYELVAPEGARPVAGQSSGSVVGGMQRMMKDALKLQFQLDIIDYSKDNFVHADMTPEEFSKSMSERGESFLQLFFRAMGQGMAQQGAGNNSDLQMLMALTSRNRSTRLKEVMAKQFQQMEATMYALNGPDGTTIINGRNKKALDVMEQQIDKGKTRLAIFYGAGHLPDMEKRLEGDYGFRARGTKWLTAWDLTRE